MADEEVRYYYPLEEANWRETLSDLNNDEHTTPEQYRDHIRLGFEKGYI